MSACNGDITPYKRTFFGDHECQYPRIADDGKIDTVQFLTASRVIVRLFDCLGKAFAPVKYDVSGNIEKLEKKYKTDPVKFQWLNDMITSEVESDSRSAITSLLWLKRGLEFTWALLHELIQDTVNGQKSENLVPICCRAYEQALKQYHSWMVQNLVKLCMRAVPWRSDLIRVLSFEQENVEELVLTDMQEYIDSMKHCLDVINALYMTYNLDSVEKV